jgi:hypothetical protein
MDYTEYEKAEPAAMAPPSLHGAVSEASEHMAKLHSQIKELAKRLEPVLLPEQPSPVADTQDAPKADLRSPVIGQISSHVRDIRSAQGRLSSLLNRLEV